MLRWATRLSAATATEASPSPSRRVSVKARPVARSTTAFHRARAYRATASSTPDIMAETAAGASA